MTKEQLNKIEELALTNFDNDPFAYAKKVTKQHLRNKDVVSVYKNKHKNSETKNPKKISKNRKDLTGNRYGKLVVTSTYWENKRAMCVCTCDCGSEVVVRGGNLQIGKKTSCGCDRTSHNKKDVTGQRFGKLTVLEMIYPDRKVSKTGKAKCRCICDCGNETVVTLSQLSTGKTKSCGCLRSESAKKKRVDLTGNRYGKLIVEEMIYGKGVSGRKRSLCKCRCDCGKEIITPAYTLTSNGKISCGCDVGERIGKKLRKDVTGMKFSRLLVTKVWWENGVSCCECKCDCGNTTTTKTSLVINGVTKSCGCYKKEVTSLTNTKDWTGVVSPTGIKFIEPSHKVDGLWVWKCECGVCGKGILAFPHAVMSGHKKSCGCLSESFGEKFIDDILKEFDVNYKREYTFTDCKDKAKLRFDFAIFNCDDQLQFLVEYDGIQHFEEHFIGDEPLEERQRRDDIKNDYCKKKNIELLRIPYYIPFTDVKEIIVNKINNTN